MTLASIPQIDLVTVYCNINRGFIGALEEGVNDGTFVRWVLSQTGNSKGDPWCCSGQQKAGHMMLRDKWPQPLTAECKAIGDWATRTQCLLEVPAVGSQMLFWHQQDSRGPRFAHIGCVLEVIDLHTVRTSEGNTTGGTVRPGGTVVREGNGWYEKIRTIEPLDRFCYWWIPLGGKV
jgi:hypothetical protein